MIIPFSVRDNHPEDAIIIQWYNGIERYERSRKIREALLYYIRNCVLVSAHSPPSNQEPPANPLPKIEIAPVELKKVDITSPLDEDDLDKKLDMLGGKPIV